MKKKSIFVIDDIYQIAEQMIDASGPDRCIVAVGYYDTIVDLLNILLKSDMDYEYVAGQLEPEEWDGYDEAWYIELQDDELYTGKMYNEEFDDYIYIESNHAYVEEDFLDQYLSNNNSTGVTVFGFDDVHDEVESDNYYEDCLHMDKDNYGFTFYAANEYGYQRLRYRGNHILTEDDALDIVSRYLDD